MMRFGPSRLVRIGRNLGIRRPVSPGAVAGAFRLRAGSDFGRSTDKERDDERGRHSEGRDGPYMVPHGPARKVAAPVALSVGAVRLDGRQCFVTRHVVGGRQQDRADEEVRGKAFVPRQERRYRQGTASQRSSKSTAMKAGVTSPR